MNKALLAVAVFCASGSIFASGPAGNTTEPVPDAPATAPVEAGGPEVHLARLSPAQRAKLDAKVKGLAGRRFGDPDLAEQFYVNSRTGPIITRGPNRTVGTRTLSPEMYFPGLEHADLILARWVATPTAMTDTYSISLNRAGSNR